MDTDSHKKPNQTNMGPKTNLSSKICAGCGLTIEHDATVCVTCGLNQLTGRKAQTVLTLRDPWASTANPVVARIRHPDGDGRDDETQSHGLFEIIMRVLKALLVLAFLAAITVIVFVLYSNRANILNRLTSETTPPPPPVAPTPPPRPMSPLAKAGASGTSAATTPPSSHFDSSVPEASSNLLGPVEWGMPRAALISAIGQTKTLLADTTNTVVYHKTQACDRECIIAYRFRNDSLVEQHIAFALPNKRELLYFSTEDGYLEEYAKLRSLLSAKYGAFAEEKKDLDIGLALNRWQRQKDQLAEAVDYERQREEETDIRLRNEADMWKAKRWDSNKRYSHTEREALDQRFEATQRSQRAWQAEAVAEARTRLRKHEACKPSQTWESVNSKFGAQDSDILLTCRKTQSGISIIVTYKVKGATPLPTDL